MKVYSEEFKADAVALYVSDPAATYASVAEDLGVNRETLRLWVKQCDENGGLGALVALVGQGEDSRIVQFAQDSPDPGCGEVVSGAGQRARCPEDRPVWCGDDLDVG